MTRIEGKDDAGREQNLNGCSWVPGFPEALRAVQAAPASATDAMGCVVARGGVRVARVRVTVGHAPAVGESMTIDIKKKDAAGTVTSLLSAPFNVTAAGVFELAIVKTVRDVPQGCLLEAVRAYVAGGGPAMSYTEIRADFGGDTVPC